MNIYMSNKPIWIPDLYTNQTIMYADVEPEDNVHVCRCGARR